MKCLISQYGFPGGVCLPGKNELMTKMKNINWQPSKLEALSRCCFKVGPTLKQHRLNVSCLQGSQQDETILKKWLSSTYRIQVFVGNYMIRNFNEYCSAKPKCGVCLLESEQILPFGFVRQNMWYYIWGDWLNKKKDWMKKITFFTSTINILSRRHNE